MFTLPLLLASLAAADDLDAEAYAKRYATRVPTAAQQETLQRCLTAWKGESPFTNLAETPVRIIQTKVRVMGMGATETRDDTTTSYDQLVLIEPSVNVLTGTTFSLLNPRGWYCFDQTTTALGKLTIRLDCGANMANSHGGAVVMGGDSSTQGGVVVMGGVSVERVGCAEQAKPGAVDLLSDEASTPAASAPAGR